MCCNKMQNDNQNHSKDCKNITHSEVCVYTMGPIGETGHVGPQGHIGETGPAVSL